MCMRLRAKGLREVGSKEGGSGGAEADDGKEMVGRKE